MKVIELVPEVCKGKEGVEPTFSGKVVIQCPTFDQRYELIERSGFAMDDDGKMLAGAKQLSAIRKAVSLVNEMAMVKEVQIKKLSDGSEFKSFEDLTYDPDCDPILIELATQVMNGFRVTKK